MPETPTSNVKIYARPESADKKPPSPIVLGIIAILLLVGAFFAYRLFFNNNPSPAKTSSARMLAPVATFAPRQVPPVRTVPGNPVGRISDAQSV